MNCVKFLHILLVFLTQQVLGDSFTSSNPFHLRVRGLDNYPHLNWHYLSLCKNGALGVLPPSLGHESIGTFVGLLRDGRLHSITPKATVSHQRATQVGARISLSANPPPNNIGFKLVDDTTWLHLPNRILKPTKTPLSPEPPSQFYLCPIPYAQVDHALKGGFEWVDRDNLYANNVLHHPYYLYTTNFPSCLPVEVFREGLGPQ